VELGVTEHNLEHTGLPLVVLVHGALDRAHSFHRVVDNLPDLRVITYDRRGYGRSVGATPASGLGDQSADLLEVIGERRATVVTHSAASHIGVLAAIADPGRIVSLGLWEPAAPWMEFWPERARESVARIASASDPSAVAERGMKAMIGKEAWNRLGEARRQQHRAEGPAFILDMASGLEAPYDWADLRVPYLIGHGSSWPHAETSPQLADALSCPTFVIAEAPHAAHRSHPAAFAAFVRRATALAENP
jgi:pimeloyl-ACP methyl ester carboxylesterase